MTRIQKRNKARKETNQMLIELSCIVLFGAIVAGNLFINL